MTHIETRHVFICELCQNYCDTNDCYNCEESTGVLTPVEIDTNYSFENIKRRMKKTNRNYFDVMLSKDGDGPAEIDIVKMGFEKLLDTIRTTGFIENNIVAVWDKGTFRNCIGLALLNPYKYKSEDVRGLFIVIEY